MIVKPFNAVFCVLILITFLSAWLIAKSTKNMPEKKKLILMLILCAVNFIIFVVYKLELSHDTDYYALSGIEKNWLNELPLHLCNINMFLIPIGLLLKDKSLLGFSFYIAPLGAFMALVCPEREFIGYSLFMPRILGFHLTHMLLIVCGISIYTLGFYKPKVKDCPGIIGSFLLVSFGVHILNTLLRLTVCKDANYFFTYGGNVNALDFFWKLIPVPYLYGIPAILILMAYMAIISLLFLAVDKRKEKRRHKSL